MSNEDVVGIVLNYSYHSSPMKKTSSPCGIPQWDNDKAMRFRAKETMYRKALITTKLNVWNLPTNCKLNSYCMCLSSVFFPSGLLAG